MASPIAICCEVPSLESVPNRVALVGTAANRRYWAGIQHRFLTPLARTPFDCTQGWQDRLGPKVGALSLVTYEHTLGPMCVASRLVQMPVV